MSYRPRIGHAHLKVGDLERAIRFYREFLQLEITERVGNRYAFLSAGTFHHDLALQEVGPNAPRPEPWGTGLYHVAFEVQSQRELALAYQRLKQGAIPLIAVDHLISWAIYFEDPDGNGLEIYWDTRTQPFGSTTWQGQNLPLPENTLLSVLKNTHR